MDAAHTGRSTGRHRVGSQRPVLPGQPGPVQRARSRPWLLVVAAVSLLIAAACGNSVEATDSGVETMTAAEAAAARSLPDDPDGVLPDLQDQEQSVEPVETTEQTSPEVTGEIRPPADDTKVLITGSGVVLGIVGQTTDGYVVQTPCGSQTVVTGGLPLGPVQVVIDPGHGGDEQGATDIPSLSEAELNLTLARAAAEQLRARSVTVMLTRDADYRIPIQGRAELADLVEPAAFVSIHHNSSASRPSPVPGTEVYVQTSSAESRRLGGLLYEEAFAALQQFDVEWTARDDAGVLTVVTDTGEDAYGINRYPTTPSALIEMAYMGNEQEAELLLSHEYVQVAAVALADGIERFLTSTDEGTGFVETPRLFTSAGGTGGSTGCIDPILQ